MPPQPLQLLERTLEPVVAEFIRLALLFTVATSIALVVLAVVMLALNLIAAWREAHAARALPGVSGNTSMHERRLRRTEGRAFVHAERNT